MPRLCVCIPTWNGAAYLERTLRSVLAQQGVDLRVIVGDDRSDDETVRVARRIDDPRLSVHAFQERAGLAGNWNRVLGRSDGEFVALVGQDDEVKPWWAARLVGLLDAHQEADLAFGRRAFAFEDEASRERLGDFFERTYPAMLAPFYDRIGEVIPPEIMIEEAYRHRFEINLIGEPTFVVMRRSASAIATGFDPSLSQLIDWEFFTRFFVDRPIVHCPDILGTYHLHAGGASLAHASLHTHYREFDRLLGTVLQRFVGVLGDERTAGLERRQLDVRERLRSLAAAGRTGNAV